MAEEQNDNGFYTNRYFDYKDDKDAVEAEEELFAALQAAKDPKALWEDATFPANAFSIYRQPFRPPMGSMPQDAFRWLRIHQQEIVDCHTPITFSKKKQEISDIRLGALGNRWFISAVGILASEPEIIRRLIVSDRYASRGIYTVKFMKNGHWRYVHVDDKVPCNLAGKPVFAHSKNPNQTWLMILEKAYAKLHGCYENLISGYLSDGLQDCFGKGFLKWKFNNMDIKKKLDDGSLFEDLIALRENGCLISCVRDFHSETDLLGGKNKDGLLTGYGYSVEELLPVHAEPTDDRDGLNTKLVRIRDCWGLSPWKGQWSKTCTSWLEYPTVKDSLWPEFDNSNAPDDGMIWVTWDDFLSHFTELNIGIIYDSDNGVTKLIEGEWIPGDPKSGSGGVPQFNMFCQNPQYAFSINQTVNMVITVGQRDMRWQEPDPAPIDCSIGVALIRLIGNKNRCTRYMGRKVVAATRTPSLSRSTSISYNLPLGRYVIIPYTFDPCNDQKRFYLEMSTNAPMEFDSEDVAELDDVTSDVENEAEAKEYPFQASEFELEENIPYVEEMERKNLESLYLQVSDVSKMISGLKDDLAMLDSTVAKYENHD